MASPAEFIGRRVGRFAIQSHLASGGMAELFIARQEAVGGFEKDLVLKMLQGRYAEHPRVVNMFLDEARLAAKLNHQNIVHVYDVGEADGVRYIAMEYIHGETITDIVRQSIARGAFLPLEHAVQIVADTAAGLAYAHDRRDAEGRSVCIVHRDVSPSNILVTYEGVTKIVDFGIARVQDQIKEESGMRPGKVSYMSPEQARGEPVDHRSDIFSLGIILYEITVGRRLWRGSPAEVIKRIVDEQIPPPTYVRRDYPPALELIVMRALEKRAADRYSSARDLQRELHEFLDEARLKSGPRRLGEYMKELFGSRSEDPIIQTEIRDQRRRDESGPTANPEELEELDFDRRAPLVMRVEPRIDEPSAPVVSASGPTEASGVRSASGPLTESRAESRGESRVIVGASIPSIGNEAPRPTPVRAVSNKPGASAASFLSPQRADDADTSDDLAPEPAARSPRAGGSAGRAAGAQKSRSGLGFGLVVLLVLSIAAAVVFVASK